MLYATEKGNKIKEVIHGVPISITSITINELLVGLKENETNKLKNFFSEVTVFDFDKKAAIKSAQLERALKSEGKLINKVDMLIAGISLVYNCTLLTCDQDFKKIKDFKVMTF